MEKKLISIAHPNTVADSQKAWYTEKNGYSFKYIMKSGEMSGIAWIEVYQNDKLVAEVKESVCDLFFK